MVDREFCYRLNKNVDLLVERFAERYFDEVPEIRCQEEGSDSLRFNFFFNEEIYFNVDNMFTALWYQIPREVLFAWWDIQSGNVQGPKVSLLNFYLYKEE